MSRTYRSPWHSLVQLLLAIPVTAAGILVPLLILGGWAGLLLAVAVGSFALVSFLRAARVKVETDDGGVVIANHDGARRLTWNAIEEFVLDEPDGPRPPRGFVRLRGGERLRVDVLQGADLAPARHRRWARGAVTALNDERRARTDL
jgi:hypothetical protein